MHKCLLDMDGVLVDFIGGVSKLFDKENPYDNPSNYGRWELETLLSIDPKSFWNSLDTVFWTNLDWTPDGKDILTLVEDYFGARNVCLLSSPPKSKCGDCMHGKINWIEKHIPEYRRRFLFGAAKEFCAGSLQHMLVDDNDFNVEQFTLHGGRAFLFPRPWNSRYHSHSNSLEKLSKFLESI